MSLKFYFDGCSYTKGHDVESQAYAWPLQINAESNPVDGHQNQNGNHHEYCALPFINNSEIARSNDSIFTSFMIYFNKIIKNHTKVILYLSHSERFANGFEIDPEKQYRGLSTKFTYSKANPSDPNVHVPLWVGGTFKTLAIIHNLITLAKKFNMDLTIITQDNYNWFKFISKIDDEVYDLFKSIDYEKYIFNWPSPKLKNFNFVKRHPHYATFEDTIEMWGCTGFALQLAKGLGNKNEWVSNDLKHFTEEGHKWLARALLDFSKDPSKNMSYYIDELSLEKQRLFYDRDAWIEQYFYNNDATHWVENKIKNHFKPLLEDIKKNKNFIYEE